jgi:hypothetical protein
VVIGIGITSRPRLLHTSLIVRPSTLHLRTQFQGVLKCRTTRHQLSGFAVFLVKDVSVLRELSKYRTQFSAEVVLSNKPLLEGATSKTPSTRALLFVRSHSATAARDQFDALTGGRFWRFYGS